MPLGAIALLLRVDTLALQVATSAMPVKTLRLGLLLLSLQHR